MNGRAPATSIAEAKGPSALPAVSVLVQTYNHETYVAEALRGVLMQKTSLPTELIIGDDCSMDSTRETIRDVLKSYDYRARLVFPDHRLGHQGGELFLQLLGAARGRYIAYLDGDDVWFDESKLERQAAFLEERPDCSICFHDAISFSDDASEPAWDFRWRGSSKIAVEEIYGTSNFVPTSSVMVRNLDDWRGLEWARDLTCMDWAFNITVAQRGWIGHIGRTMAARRVGSAGMWSSLDRLERLREIMHMHATLPDSILEVDRPAFAYGRSKLLTLFAVEVIGIPAQATVAVISDGDPDLVRLGDRRAWHFPRHSSGSYGGHRFADSSAAIMHLEQLIAEGARFLVVPEAAIWWLEYYEGLRSYLNEHAKCVWKSPNAVIYKLADDEAE